MYLAVVFIAAGTLQGILEWLPISSEAFIFLFLVLCGIPSSTALLLAMVFHLPTGISAIIYYRREYKKLFIDITNLRLSRLSMYVILSTLSTGIVAVPLYFALKGIMVKFEQIIDYVVSAIMMMIGVLMIITGILTGKTIRPGDRELEDCRPNDAIYVGLAQGFSILPGVSRSAVTIAALLYRKFDERSSINGSFILSGVVSIGVFVFLLVAGELSLQFIMNKVVLLSIVFTIIMSLLVIRFMLDLAEKLRYAGVLRFTGILMLISGILTLIV